MYSELIRRNQSRNIIFIVIILLSIILGSCKIAPPVEKIDKQNADYVYERVEAVMDAYYSADFEAISSLSNGKFSASDFLAADWPGSENVFTALTEGKKWEINRDSVYTEPEFFVEVEMEHAKLASVIDDWLSGDDEFHDMISCLVQRERGEIGYDEFDNIYYPWLAKAYPDALSDAGTVSFKTEVKFEYDAEADEWYLSELPNDFTLCSNRYIFSPLMYLSGDFTEQMFTLDVARKMVYDGDLLETEYFDLYEFYYEHDYFSAKTVPVSEVIEAIEGYSFSDYETNELIYAPPSGAKGIQFIIVFSERFEEVAFYYRLYKDSVNQDNLVKGDISYFTNLWSDNVVIFDDELLTELEPGNYIFRVELEMGGVVLEEEFTVQ
ncbi:MAG: hypothetical protein GXY06_00740 [Clostridiaceae bacterium]|nr:hypothetical protein [Clostridiaceae bacterium]